MEEGKEKKKNSPKKVGLIASGLILLVIIVLLLFRGITISKKETPQNNDTGNVELNAGSPESEGTESDGETDEKTDNFGNVISEEEENNSDISSEDPQGISENNKESEEVKSQEEETDNFGNKIENNEDESESTKVEGIQGSSEGTNSSMVEVENPTLGEVLTSDVLVSGKSIYKVGNESYTYSLDLIFPGDGDYKVIKYYCSKRTYDGVSEGDTITASYQSDENGLISIITISKS